MALTEVTVQELRIKKGIINLSPDATCAQIVDALQIIKGWTDQEAIKPACDYARDKNADDRAEAVWYLAQTKLLEMLIWALGGEGTEDGCGPEIEFKVHLLFGN